MSHLGGSNTASSSSLSSSKTSFICAIFATPATPRAVLDHSRRSIRSSQYSSAHSPSSAIASKSHLRLSSGPHREPFLGKLPNPLTSERGVPEPAALLSLPVSEIFFGAPRADRFRAWCRRPAVRHGNSEKGERLSECAAGDLHHESEFVAMSAATMTRETRSS
jgi:hypothetical protein